MKIVKMPVEMAEGIARYLAHRPWAEVNMMMADLRQMKPIDDDEPMPMPQQEVEPQTKKPHYEVQEDRGST